jgi:hypothetical protein
LEDGEDAVQPRCGQKGELPGESGGDEAETMAGGAWNQRHVPFFLQDSEFHMQGRAIGGGQAVDHRPHVIDHPELFK